jgi:hypothetical protein
MKRYTVTLTINVHFEAKNEEAAELVAQEMDYDFIHPDTGEKMNQDLIDWELNQQRKSK